MSQAGRQTDKPSTNNPVSQPASSLKFQIARSRWFAGFTWSALPPAVVAAPAPGLGHPDCFRRPQLRTPGARLAAPSPILECLLEQQNTGG